MKKTVAIPAKFLVGHTGIAREDLSDAEKAELAKFGESDLTDDDIAQHQADASRHEAEKIPRQKAKAAELRWVFEESGTFFSGFPVDTTRSSQGKIMNEMMRIQLGWRSDDEEYKYADGVSRRTSNAEFELLAQAMTNHVKLAHVLESEINKSIDEEKFADLEQLVVEFSSLIPAS